MKTLSIFAGAALAASIGASAMPAYATTLNWTLENVTFSDGGSAAGTFSTDSATGDITAFDITTSTGSVLDGAVYDGGIGYVDNDYYAKNSTEIFSNTQSAYIELAFVDPLTSGTVDQLVLNSKRTGASSFECDDCKPYRVMTSGEAVFSGPAVPEPAAWAMMLVGFGGLGAAMRSRRRFVASAV